MDILKKIQLTIIGMFIIPMTLWADDNEITILQEGNNFELDVTQIGYNNIIKQWTSSEGIDGVDNTIIIKQANDRGASGDQNILEIRRVWGDRNTLKLGQGYHVSTSGNFTIDNQELGDTFAHLNITGDDNTILMSQRTNNSSSGHEYWLHLEGDDNDIFTVQREGGSQYINLDIYTDGNDVDLIQKMDGDHYMSVILRGTEPTTIDVTQASNQSKSYSVTNYCYTTSGCSISVTQQ